MNAATRTQAWIVSLLAGSALALAAVDARVIEAHEQAVLSLCWSRDGAQLLTGGADNAARLWNSQTGKEVRAFDFKYAMSGVALSPDGRTAASGSWGVQLWDTATGRMTRHLEAHTGFVTSVAFSPDGTSLASGGLDSTVRLTQPSTGQETRLLQHPDQINGIAFSWDGRWIAAAGDTTVMVWEASSGRTVSRARLPGATSVAFTPDGSRLLVGRAGRTVTVVSCASWSPERELTGHNGKVTAVAVSSDGSLAASSSVDQTVRVWPLTSQQPAQVLSGHRRAVNCVAFSPDGRSVASGGADGTLRIWPVASATSR
jgi:WD40 repeat protein